MELSCQKKPREEKLQGEWENNKESLISFLERAKSAVKGIVTDEKGNTVETTTTTTTEEPEKDGIVVELPLGFCLRLTWGGLAGC